MDRRHGKNSGMSLFWLLFIGCWMGCTALFAQSDPMEQFNKGVDAYAQQNHAEAAMIFEQLAQDHPSPAVFYNLGNALYRLGKKGEAVAAYHAALRLAPNHKDALFNLQFLGGQSAASLFYYQWAGWFSQKVWALATLVFLSMVSLGIVFLYRRPSAQMAKIIMAAMGMSVILAFFCFGATWIRSYWENQVLGVVIVPAAELKAEPAEVSQTLVKAQEGASGYILGETDDWYYFQLDGMEPGWVPKANLKNTATWK